SEIIVRGISQIAGPDVAKLVAADGLAKMHLHFAPEFLPFLVRYLETNGRTAALRATSIVGSAVMGIDTPFYIDETIVYRFHYPHEVSIRSKLYRDQYLKLNLSNLSGAREELEAAYAIPGNSKGPQSRRVSYHRNLPVAAWILGAHKDTWLGHTFDAM